jgi:hypothetical protein
MELARTRFQAAQAGWFVLDGGAGDLEIAREAVTIVLPGPVLRLATVATPWTGILGVIIDQGLTPRLATKTQRLLVDVTQIVGLKITD